MHFLHPDHFPVTQIEVKIYFWFIWVALEQQKWHKKNQNRKWSFWRWDSNVPKILNSVICCKGSCQGNALNLPLHMMFVQIRVLEAAQMCWDTLYPASSATSPSAHCSTSCPLPTPHQPFTPVFCLPSPRHPCVTCHPGRVPVTLIPGDGVGPEIMDSAQEVLQAMGAKVSHLCVDAPVIRKSPFQHQNTSGCFQGC